MDPDHNVQVHAISMSNHHYHKIVTGTRTCKINLFMAFCISVSLDVPLGNGITSAFEK